MGFDDAELTQDAFLGGRVLAWQPRRGYRAGIDAVLLAAAVAARPGDSVLELGCGVGVAGLCLAARVPGVSLAGVELQEDYAALARRNAAQNATSFDVHCADLRVMPAALRAQSFDHVMANPPYFSRARGSAAPDGGRDTALAGDTPLADWLDAATRRLRPGGRLTIIQKGDRLGDVLAAIDSRLGAVHVLPISPRHGRDAELILIAARKGAGAPLRLAAPLVLHEGDRHLRDGDSYRAEIQEILRNAAPLNFAD